MDAAGWAQNDIARHFGVSEAAISQTLKKHREGGHAAVQPVAPDDLELVPVQVRPRVLAQVPPPPVVKPAPAFDPSTPGSEWRGIALGQTLRDRYLQLRALHGTESALAFAQREAWTLHRQGVSVEAISQQFDLPTADVQALLDKARTNALERINSFDVRVSLAAALADLEAARHAALRALNSPNSSEHRRAQARADLIRLAQAETQLAVTISEYRNAAGLDANGSEEVDVHSVDFWLKPNTERTTR